METGMAEDRRYSIKQLKNMKRVLLIFSLLAAALSCSRKETSTDGESAVTYVNVGVRLTGPSDTKSVLTAEAENFHSALLLAYNPATGELLRYGANAGSLEGSPIVKTTSSSSFSWPLPMNTELRIYCIINPPQVMSSGVTNGLYNNEKQIMPSKFVCSNVSSLAALGQSSAGLPKAGVLNIGKDEFTEDNSSISIEVKNLFAKFGLTVDKTGIPESAGFKVNSVKVFAANTSVPYFSDEFRQTDALMLKDFDYATASDLQKLSRGGSQNGIVLYAIENCQGIREGARTWKSVREDLSSWADINLCTRLLIEYELNSTVYAKEIFLGSGDMKTDFNVRRNIYKNIVLRPGEDISENSPFFSFNDDVVYSHPGDDFSSTDGIHSNLEGYGSLSLAFNHSDGRAADNLFLNTSVNASGYGFSVSSSAELGEYYITGGIHGDFYWPTFGTTVSSVTDKVRLVLTEQKKLTFELTTPAGDIYPYLPVKYKSKEYFPLSNANSVIESIRFLSLPENIANYYTVIDKVLEDRGYRIAVTVYPSHPGTMEGLSISYGEEGASAAFPPVTVLAPDVLVWNDDRNLSAATEEGKIRVDALGTNTNCSWKLCRQGSADILTAPVCGALAFSVSKTDPYGTMLKTSKGRVTGSTAAVVINVSGFSNLPGFNADNYTFNGLNLKVKGVFTYPGGYSVSSETDAFITNPLNNYSYDGKTLEYKVHQGRSAQEEYVTVSSDYYTPEYMLSWTSRVFSVDLTRNRSRACNGLEVWTEYSTVENISGFKNKAALPSYVVKIYENMKVWGAVYYGKKLMNSISRETMTFVHSIIRIYNHYNVFAAYDAQEKKTAPPDWDDLGNYSWPFYLLWYYLGCFNAHTVNNFDLGSDKDELSPLIETSITSSTRAQPVLTGYSRLVGRKIPAHGTLSTAARNNYQIYEKAGSAPFYRHYVIGYYDNKSQGRYSIFYDWVYAEGVDNSYLPIYWRLVAASNQPWFKVGSGDYTKNGRYISKVARTNTGEYNFTVVPSGDKSQQNLYKDKDGNGYQYIHLFWEDKPGRVVINSKKMNPATNYNADLCIVNGWYNPGLYSNGLPVLKEHVGMYFYPESTSSNSRAGYPAYYSYDKPYSLYDEAANMETSLRFGNLDQRDRDAAR